MPGLLRRRSTRPTLLCHVNHYFGHGSEFSGKSTRGNPDTRTKIVQQVVDAIRRLPMDVDLRVCGFPGSALVPVDLDLSSIGDPRHIVYASIEQMFDLTDDYDYFLNIEDDILIDAQAVASMVRFAATAEINEVYLPNRMERDADGGLFCVDRVAIPGWTGLVGVFDGVAIDSAVNPHAGLMFLTRQQMTYARSRVDLSRRAQFLGGHMASAFANVHQPFLLWRAKSDELAHHVLHLDPWMQSPVSIAHAGESASVETTEAPRLLGSLDEIVLRGLTCTVRGWGVLESGEPMPVRAVVLAGDELTDFELERTERPDVVAAHPWADLNSGFSVTFSLLDVPAGSLEGNSLSIVGRDDQRDVSVHDPGTAVWPTVAAQRAVADAPEIGDAPFMPASAVHRLEQLLGDASCYLEYGTGGSTVLAHRVGVPHIIAVESDASWLAAVKHKLCSRESTSSLDLMSVDIGATGEWGFPTSDEAWRNYQRYPMAAWDFCRSSGLSPEVILVDGRFRAACLLASFLHAAPGTRILFDDYYDRPHYFFVERVVTPELRHDRVAEFVVPHEKPVEDLWRLLLESVTDAR